MVSGCIPELLRFTQYGFSLMPSFVNLQREMKATNRPAEPYCNIYCRLCHLDGTCLAGNLSKDESAQHAQALTPMEPIKSGEHIFTQGDSFESLYIVRAGTAKSYITAANGQVQIVSFHFPGEILGMDAFENRCYHSSAQALETLSLFKFSPEAFDMLRQACPNFHTHCQSMFSRELIYIHEMIRVIGQGSIKEKLSAFLLGISARMKELGYSEREFMLTMSRNDIASFLCVASETVSRGFTQLQKESVLLVDRRQVCIESMETLKMLAENT